MVACQQVQWDCMDSCAISSDWTL